MRDNITKLSCKPHDSITVFETNIELLNIDTNSIKTNLNMYFADLGWSYYRMFLISNDSLLIRKSINNYKRCNQLKPNNSGTLWQLSFLYYSLKDCESGKYYLEIFKLVTEKKYWREDQIELMIKGCEN